MSEKSPRNQGDVKEGPNREGGKLDRPTPSPALARTAARPLTGSLPLALHGSGQGADLAPALVFSPAHLRSRSGTQRSGKSDGTIGQNGRVSPAQNGEAVVSGIESDGDFGRLLEELLGADAVDVPSRFRASLAGASYDFDEYVFLRPPADPYSAGRASALGGRSAMPADPAFRATVRASVAQIDNFVAEVLEDAGETPPRAVLARELSVVLQA